jgi:hypothetical protein
VKERLDYNEYFERLNCYSYFNERAMICSLCSLCSIDIGTREQKKEEGISGNSGEEVSLFQRVVYLWYRLH